MIIRLENKIVESMDRMEIFDNLELDCMEEVGNLPTFQKDGFSVVDLQEYEEEL